MIITTIREPWWLQLIWSASKIQKKTLINDISNKRSNRIGSNRNKWLRESIMQELNSNVKTTTTEPTRLLFYGHNYNSSLSNKMVTKQNVDCYSPSTTSLSPLSG